MSLYDEADKDDIAEDDDGVLWVRVPYTGDWYAYNSTAEEVVYKSNIRSIWRDLGEERDDVIELDNDIAFRADTEDSELIEIYQGMKEYPLYDESDESELRMEYEEAAWRDWMAYDMVKRLIHLHPEYEEYLDDLDAYDEAIANALWDPMWEAMEARGIYVEWDHDPFIPDFDDVVADVDISKVIEATAAVKFQAIASERLRELVDYVQRVTTGLQWGIGVSNPLAGPEAAQNMQILLMLLVDEGVGVAQAFGRPEGFYDLYEDETEAATAAATARKEASLRPNDVTLIAQGIERDHETELRFARLLHRWMAAQIAADSMAYMAQVFEGEEVPDDPVFTDYTLAERIDAEYERWAPTLAEDYPIELPPTWLEEKYWAELQAEADAAEAERIANLQLSFDFKGLGGYDYRGWEAA